MRGRMPRTGRQIDLVGLRQAMGSPSQTVFNGIAQSKIRSTTAGAVIDVLIPETGLEETARVAAVYAGSGFGFYSPVQVGDELLLVAPGGSLDRLHVLPGSLWNGDATALEEDGAELSNDLVLIVSEGNNLRLQTSGAGAINIVATGEGNVTIQSEKEIHISAAEKVIVESALVELKNRDAVLTAIDGIVGGWATDPYTGQTQFALGNASTKVRGER